MMRRERIEKKAPRKPTREVEVLPLDPRDPDVVHAKELLQIRRRRSSA